MSRGSGGLTYQGIPGLALAVVRQAIYDAADRPSKGLTDDEHRDAEDFLKRRLWRSPWWDVLRDRMDDTALRQLAADPRRCKWVEGRK